MVLSLSGLVGIQMGQLVLPATEVQFNTVSSSEGVVWGRGDAQEVEMIAQALLSDEQRFKSQLFLVAQLGDLGPIT